MEEDLEHENNVSNPSGLKANGLMIYCRMFAPITAATDDSAERPEFDVARRGCCCCRNDIYHLKSPLDQMFNLNKCLNQNTATYWAGACTSMLMVCMV